MLRDRIELHALPIEKLEMLMELRDAKSFWRDIADALPGEHISTLRKFHFARAHAKKPAEKQSGSLWTLEEDRILVQLSNVERLPFAEIAKKMPERMSEAIALRFRMKSGTLSQPKYTTEELNKIVQLRHAGMKWKDIEAQLPGRTCAVIKHVFYDRLRNNYSIEEGTVLWHSTPANAKNA